MSLQCILMIPLAKYYLRLHRIHRKKFFYKLKKTCTATRQLHECVRICVCVCVCFTYLVVFAERLQHLLELYLQLVTVALTKLTAAHLLGGGEGVEGLVEEEDVLLVQ